MDRGSLHPLSPGDVPPPSQIRAAPRRYAEFHRPPDAPAAPSQRADTPAPAMDRSPPSPPPHPPAARIAAESSAPVRMPRPPASVLTPRPVPRPPARSAAPFPHRAGTPRTPDRPGSPPGQDRRFPNAALPPLTRDSAVLASQSRIATPRPAYRSALAPAPPAAPSCRHRNPSLAARDVAAIPADPCAPAPAEPPTSSLADPETANRTHADCGSRSHPDPQPAPSRPTGESTPPRRRPPGSPQPPTDPSSQSGKFDRAPGPAP